MRTRDLGITIGLGRPGPLNAITDVAGVRVGHATIIEGDGPLVVGQGPVRTGVTVVVPRGPDDWREPVFAGCHRLNGNGELTGLEWVRESGKLTTPIAITNTHSVGVVRDALVAASVEHTDPRAAWWSLPVVGETYDGLLNDINGFHVRAEHLRAALDTATGGPVAEGNVGGGTGMVCHEFKGGIGTASRVVPADRGGHTVGVLVQANYGKRAWLRVDGVPVGAEIGVDEVPSPYGRGPRERPRTRRPAPARSSSSSRPTPPCSPTSWSASRSVRVWAWPAPVGRAGTPAATCSSPSRPAIAYPRRTRITRSSSTYDVRTVGDIVIDALFDATIEATEEAIINALVAAETMVGRDGITAHALPHDRLLEVMARYGRGPRTTGRPPA